MRQKREANKKGQGLFVSGNMQKNVEKALIKFDNK